MQTLDKFPPELRLLFKGYFGYSRDYLKDKVSAVYILGGAALEDWIPEWGDVDFLTVVDGDIDAQTEKAIHKLHDHIIKSYGSLAETMEGDYYPAKKFCGQDTGLSHMSIGNRGEEREMKKDPMSAAAARHIKKYGCLIYGKDLRSGLPDTDEEEVGRDVAREFRDFIILHHPSGPPFSTPRSVNSLFGYGTKGTIYGWLQGAVCLLYLKCGTEATKSSAGRDYRQHIGDQFSELVTSACRIRNEWPPQIDAGVKLKQLAGMLSEFLGVVWDAIGNVDLDKKSVKEETTARPAAEEPKEIKEDKKTGTIKIDKTAKPDKPAGKSKSQGRKIKIGKYAK